MQHDTPTHAPHHSPMADVHKGRVFSRYLLTSGTILIFAIVAALDIGYAILLTGCDRPAPGPAPAAVAVASQLDQWTYGARSDDDRIDLLTTRGLIRGMVIAADTVTVQINTTMHDELDAADRERFRQLVYRVARRNVPGAVVRISGVADPVAAAFDEIKRHCGAAVLVFERRGQMARNVERLEHGDVRGLEGKP